MRLSKNKNWIKFLRKLNLFQMKYQLEKLEIRSQPVNILRNSTLGFVGTRNQQNIVHSSSSSINEIYPETGFYIHRRTIGDLNSLFNDDDDNNRLTKKTDEIKDTLDESTLRINNELRKIALDLQNELEDIKRRLIR
jgi:hypothetical protein